MVRVRGLFGAGLALLLLAACGGASGVTPAALSAGRPLAIPLASGFKVLYSFGKASTDGIFPEGNALEVGGKFYATTYCGGKYGSASCTGSGTGGGTVISIGPDGTGEKVLHSFNHGTDGSNPDAGLIDVKGTLYTTTVNGGANGDGAVVAITPAGKERVVYSFKGGPNDGANPYGPVIDVNGTLYGLTYYGGNGYGCGSNYCGTVFSLTPSGTEKVIHSFNLSKGDGGFPAAGLLDVKGTFYGTTYEGGKDGRGTVFSVTAGGKEKVLYSFANGTDGGNPSSTLINVNGTLYGTSVEGGLCGSKSCDGAVFSITTSGTEKGLYSFKGGSDGANPTASLIAVGGALYGTTAGGGSAKAGTVFAVTTKGVESVLTSFAGGSGGTEPYGSLLYINGKLYGFTVLGGSYHSSGGGGGTLYVLDK